MMCDIQQLVGRLIAKAEQLLGMQTQFIICIKILKCITSVYYCHNTIGNFTTNLAESWMHIRSKFDEGKQINRSQSGSWEGRCAGAGLRQVLGPSWGPAAWRNATGCDANHIFKCVSNMKDKPSDHRQEKEVKCYCKGKKENDQNSETNDNSQQARRDYARHNDGPGVSDVPADVPNDYLQKKMMLDYYAATVAVTDEKKEEVERVTRKQGNDDIGGNIWMAERRKRITSSNTGIIAKHRSTTKVANLVKTLL